jgi:hypothetical protein
MTHEEYVIAAEHWDKKDATSKKVAKETLKEAIGKHIQANNTCAFASGFGDYIRCTPLEYAYHDGAFYFWSEGGKKFIGLEKNKKVCLAIYDKYQGFGVLNGLQVMGIATIIEPFSEAYIQEATNKKIPLEVLKKLPEPLHLIKVEPKHYDFLSSSFQKDGYSSRQSLDL